MEFEGNIPSKSLSFLSGEGLIKNLQRTTTQHSYIISARTNSIMLENTWYFPGWNAYLDNRPIPIIKSLKGHEGIMTTNIPSGVHKLEFVYRDDNALILLKNVLLAFLVFYGFVCLRLFLKKR
jgi:hypothetical protein